MGESNRAKEDGRASATCSAACVCVRSVVRFDFLLLAERENSEIISNVLVSRLRILDLSKTRRLKASKTIILISIPTIIKPYECVTKFVVQIMTQTYRRIFKQNIIDMF